MRPGARVQAAIEILADLEARKRPAAEAVKDWMLGHRFAGSKDRSAIGDLVFCGLRWRASSAWRLEAENPRNLVLGALVCGLGEPVERLNEHWAGDPHAPAQIAAAEAKALERTLEDAPAWVAGDYPEWAEASFARAFGADRVAQGQALAAPAPLDLRANTLKASREKVLAMLADHPRLHGVPQPTPHVPEGVRLPWTFGRSFNWAGDVAFEKGWFEVQDEGSQLAALLCEAGPGQQVADVCAGGGGKTLALAAAMQNKGQIYAYDIESQRLGALVPRLERAGARNVQVRAPAKSRDVLADLERRMDVVLVDAPCTGSGTWRRNPDAKWRLRPGALNVRGREQQAALALGARLVKPGGVLVYVTCSVFPDENEDQAAAFLSRRTDFEAAPITVSAPHIPRLHGIQFTPATTGTDGFFVCRMRRSA
jgi:16S rRNA (cytosine967-C5)-methyltransferase